MEIDISEPLAVTVFEINSPRVLGETVDGETVIIDSRTGAYYSLNECGSFIWSALRNGPTTIEAISSAVGRVYAIDRESVAQVATLLVELLLEHELVRVSSEEPTTAVTLECPTSTPVFSPPTLERFDDLEDLLLLDPIHDVDPDRGWPIAKGDG